MSDSAAYSDEQLRAALIFWVARARRFEEKLNPSTYMVARGVTTDEYEIGRRVFEESLPTTADLIGLVPDMGTDPDA